MEVEEGVLGGLGMLCYCSWLLLLFVVVMGEVGLGVIVFMYLVWLRLIVASWWRLVICRRDGIATTGQLRLVRVFLIEYANIMMGWYKHRELRSEEQVNWRIDEAQTDALFVTRIW